MTEPSPKRARVGTDSLAEWIPRVEEEFKAELSLLRNGNTKRLQTACSGTGSPMLALEASPL